MPTSETTRLGSQKFLLRGTQSLADDAATMDSLNRKDSDIEMAHCHQR
jgi:hypothetical protein